MIEQPYFIGLFIILGDPFFDFQNRSPNWTPCECYFLNNLTGLKMKKPLKSYDLRGFV